MSAQSIHVLTFDANAAVRAAELAAHTAMCGLSLRDRACLVLGEQLDCTVLTADRTWAGVMPQVQVIR